MAYILSPASITDEDRLNQTAVLLSKQWGGSIASRRATLLQKTYSWILIDRSADPSLVLGHIRLTPAVSTTLQDCAANTGVLTSVIISSQQRGKGLGRILMHLIEAQAKLQGYHILTLWTHDAEDFYTKIGYTKCEPRRALTTMVSAFENLNHKTVNNLESMLSKQLNLRHSMQTSTIPSVISNHISSDYTSEESTGQYTVWLQKRLCDEIPLQLVSLQDIRKDILNSDCVQDQISRICSEGTVITEVSLQWVLHVSCDSSNSNSSGGSSSTISTSSGSCANIIWSSGNVNRGTNTTVGGTTTTTTTSAPDGLPWARQIGPSCGIQALRFARYILTGLDAVPAMVEPELSSREVTGGVRVELSSGGAVVEQADSFSSSSSSSSDNVCHSVHTYHLTIPLANTTTILDNNQSPIYHINSHNINDIHYTTAPIQMRHPIEYTSTGSSTTPTTTPTSTTTTPASTTITLLARAIAQGYTKDGELFNIHHACSLACQLLEGYTQSGSSSSGGSERSSSNSTSGIHAEVMSVPNLTAAQLCSILSGTHTTDTHPVFTGLYTAGHPGLVLFPYDRDDIRSVPCSKRGAAAHYALLCGYVLLPHTTIGGGVSSGGDSSTTTTTGVSTADGEVHPEQLLVVGIHGLSRHPIVATWAQWVKSNSQLYCDISSNGCAGSSSSNGSSIDATATSSTSSVHAVSLRDNCVAVWRE